MTVIEFIDKHKGVGALIGAFVSVTAGATWWLAKGGAAAFIFSMNLLSDPHIAETLADLPAYHARTEAALEELKAGQEATQAAVRQLADAQEAYRADTEAVVEWAREHSQRLTDAAGGCYAGEECQVFFRGRRTQAGAACKLVAEKPRILLSSGEEYPLGFSPRHEPMNLSTEFETASAWLMIPDFIPAGIAGVVVMSLYADCPFAPARSDVSRETFRLLVEIKKR